ncbi:ZIP family metal transporter [Candidatus Aerophobetes bacterium]|nr:ZIP family metal transporter [Candidatus Aerophobetes bacterium]
MEYLRQANPILQAFFATLFTWGMTVIGASFVFFSRKANRKLLDSMLGFAAGVMISASYFSLIEPAIRMSEGGDLPVWFPVAAGFLLGSLFLLGVDRIIPHLHLGFPEKRVEGIKTKFHRVMLLVLAITLHNIPEGMAVGVAFGGQGAGISHTTFQGALSLAIGIGIQNLPEGFAVSMPLRGEGISRSKSFFYGQLSAVVEPIAAVAGAIAVTSFQPILPYALCFAAGAMIFVVIEEVIPESQLGENADLATISALSGFALMMVLDIAFG